MHNIFLCWVGSILLATAIIMLFVCYQTAQKGLRDALKLSRYYEEFLLRDWEDMDDVLSELTAFCEKYSTEEYVEWVKALQREHQERGDYYKSFNQNG